MSGENGQVVTPTPAIAAVPHGFTDTGVERDESQTLAKLAEALAKAQGAMRSAKKSTENKHFGSRYATLADVWDVIREPLSANGLAVVQRVGNVTGGVSIVTMLLHTSGEWMRDRLMMPVNEKNAQQYGSAITYARKYALSAMLGVAPDEDDDGNAASQASNGNGRYTPERVPPTPNAKTEKIKEQLKAKQAEAPPPGEVQAPAKPVAPTPWERIKAACAAKGITEDKRVGSIAKGVTGKSKPSELNDADVAAIESSLNSGVYDKK